MTHPERNPRGSWYCTHLMRNSMVETHKFVQRMSHQISEFLRMFHQVCCLKREFDAVFWGGKIGPQGSLVTIACQKSQRILEDLLCKHKLITQESSVLRRKVVVLTCICEANKCSSPLYPINRGSVRRIIYKCINKYLYIYIYKWRIFWCYMFDYRLAKIQVTMCF